MRSIVFTVRGILPKPVEQFLRSFKLRFLKNRKAEDIFSEIYAKSLWGKSKGKFCSGIGSSDENSREYVKWVNKFIVENNVKSIVDLGCGDFQVGSRFQLDDRTYTGCDIVPDLIRYNQEQFGDQRRNFKVCNIIEDDLPPGDFCMVRQVFQHLSNDSILSVLKKLKQYKYVLITDCQPKKDSKKVNLDIPNFSGTRGVVHGTGLWLENPPFNIDGEVAFHFDYDGEDDDIFRGFLIRN